VNPRAKAGFPGSADSGRACGSARPNRSRLPNGLRAGGWASNPSKTAGRRDSKTGRPPMKYAVVVEKAGNNWSAYAPDVPGCIATGKTAAETLERMAEALALHFEGLREDGTAIPDPITQVDYVHVSLPAPAEPPSPPVGRR